MNASDFFSQAEAQAKLHTEPIPAPELGPGRVLHVKRMDPEEFAHFRGRYPDEIKRGRGEAWFFVCCVCDPETGKRTFADGDLDRLMKLSGFGPLVMRGFDKAADLNAITIEAEERIEKNSETPSGASS